MTADDRAVAQALAAVASIGVLQQRPARQPMAVNSRVDDVPLGHPRLDHECASRVVVEQAKGVLAQFGGMDMDRALVELQACARRKRIGLVDLSQGLVDRSVRPSDILAPPVRRESPAITRH